MHNNCLFKEHHLLVNSESQDIEEALRKKIKSLPSVRFNIFWHCTPYLMYGEVASGTFHLSANTNIFCTFVPIIHGTITKADGNNSLVKYRIIPNNAVIIANFLFLFIQSIICYNKGSLSFLRIIESSVIIIAVVILSILFSWSSSFYEVEALYKMINEIE